ncbi:hypothetical protein [Streptomyces sp. P3]|uniref:hypothetical protein n=1 Tax=Streptomyces sp. P3 TaxID=2135430 RepID=UPI00131EF06C|nr:hypothetical protein [Streptomyces sp. P3]
MTADSLVTALIPIAADGIRGEQRDQRANYRNDRGYGRAPHLCALLSGHGHADLPLGRYGRSHEPAVPQYAQLPPFKRPFHVFSGSILHRPGWRGAVQLLGSACCWRDREEHHGREIIF